jgi:putative oxidoreductase
MAIVARVRASFVPYALLPVRFGAGLCLLLHGWPKLRDPQGFVSMVEGLGLPYGQPLAWAAIAAEVLGGVLLILGFMSRFVAFAAVIEMSVAIAFVHFGHGYFASSGGVELPLLLCLMLLGVLFGGPGRASLDSIRGRV